MEKINGISLIPFMIMVDEMDWFGAINLLRNKIATELSLELEFVEMIAFDQIKTKDNTACIKMSIQELYYVKYYANLNARVIQLNSFGSVDTTK